MTSQLALLSANDFAIRCMLYSFHNYNNDQKRKQFLTPDSLSTEASAVVHGSAEGAIGITGDIDDSDDTEDGNYGEELEMEEVGVPDDESRTDTSSLSREGSEDTIHCYDNLYTRSLWKEKYFTNLFTACRTSNIFVLTFCFEILA